MKIQSPFGPKIAIIKIPNKIISKINKEVDGILKNKSKTKKSDYSKKLVGEVKQELALSKSFVNKYLINFLKNNIKNFIKKSSNKKIKNIKLKNFWVVRQFKNEYNPTHWHGGHISGAGFLKVPKILGDNVQKKKQKQYRGGNLQLIHGARMFTCPSTYNIVPQVGDFYIFPNYLMHTVFPFKDTDEERRSISFNGVIDEEIYNVYGK